MQRTQSSLCDVMQMLGLLALCALGNERGDFRLKTLYPDHMAAGLGSPNSTMAALACYKSPP